MTIKRLLAISTISIVLSACGSDSDDPADTGTTDSGSTADIDSNDDAGGTDSGTIDSGSDDSASGSVDGSTDVSQLSGNATLYGFIGINDTADRVAASAGFIRFPSAFDTSQLSPALDECEVTQFDALDFTPDVFDFNFDDIGDFISAGEVLTFTSSAGTYVELIGTTSSSPAGEFRFYSTDIELPSPAPTTLVVDIPGAQFPSFSAQAIPVVARPEVSSPAADESVTPNTQFTWVPGTNANSVININATAGGFGSTTSTSVNCVVVDDGSFTFDSATQAAMGSDFVSGFGGFGGGFGGDFGGDFDADLFGDLFSGLTGVDIERSATRFAQSGNAVLVLTGTAGN